jgi:hypothetical protein
MGQTAKGRYKEVAVVFWQGGAGRCPLRLLVVAPTPYRKRKSSKLYYRQPAFLSTTELNSSAHQLLQIYFDRWQIEVNHRDEKDTLEWARPNSGTSRQCRSNPCWQLRPVHCCWPRPSPSVPNAGPPMKRCQSGGVMLTGPPAWI